MKCGYTIRKIRFTPKRTTKGPCVEEDRTEARLVVCSFKQRASRPRTSGGCWCLDSTDGRDEGRDIKVSGSIPEV